MTTAMLYDFMLVPGGAERLTLHALAQHPDWTLITAFTDDSAFEDSALPLDRLQTLTSLSRRQGWQALKALHAFERAAPALASFDRLLFSGAYAPAAVNGRDAGGNFYYCHTPPRFAYDLADWYRRASAPVAAPAAGLAGRKGPEPFLEQAMKRMDRVAANSETVRQRLQHHVGLEQVEVIHPPVSTAEWNWLGQEDFFLSTARLEPYKRVDLIIEAFKAMPAQKLVVASGGSQRALRATGRRADNIRFTGWCSASEIRRLTGQCRATLYLATGRGFRHVAGGVHGCRQAGYRRSRKAACRRRSCRKNRSTARCGELIDDSAYARWCRWLDDRSTRAGHA